MLPHSCQQVMYPVLQYNEGNPPAVPQLNLPPQMAQWSNYICAMVANTFGMNLHNAPRVFAYNLVAENNWRNDSFVEVVTLAFTILDLAQRQSRCKPPLCQRVRGRFADIQFQGCREGHIL